MIRESIQLRFDLHIYCLLSAVADRHVLRDLQEAAEQKMTSIYVDGYDLLFKFLSSPKEPAVITNCTLFGRSYRRVDQICTTTITLFDLDFYRLIVDSSCALVNYHAIKISNSFVY